MKLLVIGGAGYIGAHVVKELLQAGHKVVVFDNLSTGLRENLFHEAQFVHGDILDIAALSQVMTSDMDAVFHFAAHKAAGESMRKPEKYATNNLSGTINIINAMSGAGIDKVIFSSSAAVYGTPRYLPMDEDHPLTPDSFYGFTKLEIERLLCWYEKLRGFRFAALRYFNAAGYDVDGMVTGLEQNPGNLLPVLMETAGGMREKLVIFGDDYDTPDGTCVRDYIHVNDLARGHLQALTYLTEYEKSISVNLGVGRGYSVKEVYHRACDVTGVKIPMEQGPRRPGDFSRGAPTGQNKIGFSNPTFRPRDSDSFDVADVHIILRGTNGGEAL